MKVLQYDADGFVKINKLPYELDVPLNQLSNKTNVSAVLPKLGIINIGLQAGRTNV